MLQKFRSDHCLRQWNYPKRDKLFLQSGYRNKKLHCHISRELCTWVILWWFVVVWYQFIYACYSAGLLFTKKTASSLQWRQNGRDGVSNHQPHDCLLNRLFRQRKHQSAASLAFVRGIHRWAVNSPHKWPVTWIMFHLMTSSCIGIKVPIINLRRSSDRLRFIMRNPMPVYHWIDG